MNRLAVSARESLQIMAAWKGQDMRSQRKVQMQVKVQMQTRVHMHMHMHLTPAHSSLYQAAGIAGVCGQCGAK